MDPLQREAHDPGSMVPGSEQPDPIDFPLHPFQRVVDQVPLMLLDRLHSNHAEVVNRSVQAGRFDNRRRAGFKPGRDFTGSKPSQVTRSIMLPPPRKGGSASSARIFRRAPQSLSDRASCAAEGDEISVPALHLRRIVRHMLSRIDYGQDAEFAGWRQNSSTGMIVASTFETAAKAKTRVRGLSA